MQKEVISHELPASNCLGELCRIIFDVPSHVGVTGIGPPPHKLQLSARNAVHNHNGQVEKRRHSFGFPK